MKIGIYLNEYITPQAGGGFSYIHTLIQELGKRNLQHQYCLLYTNQHTEKRIYGLDLINLNIDKKCYTLGMRILLFLFKRISFISIFIQERLVQKKITQHLQKIVRDNNIDLIYYPGPMECLSTEVPFIATSWDLGHITINAFPEVSIKGQFQRRVNWYANVFPRAVAVFVESKAGQQEHVDYLNADADRLKVISIFPGNVTTLEVSEHRQNEILEGMGLKEREYFFYPAQFWAHKNHYNLIVAFEKLLQEFPDLKLVLTGSDMGNMSYIKNIVHQKSLEKSVLMPGFVDLDTIVTHYKNASALVMPTFLGPTNMPILEAAQLNCPVICSDFNGHREQLKEHAIYVDQSSPESILKAMKAIHENDDFRSDLILHAKEYLEKSDFTVSKAVSMLDSHMTDIEQLRKCWP